MPSTRVFFYQNSNLLRVTGLQNAQTNAFLNAATVEVTVTKPGGATVLGGSWPLALSYIAASNGDYEVVLPAALNLEPQKKYIAEITATEGAASGAWSVPFSAVKRTG